MKTRPVAGCASPALSKFSALSSKVQSSPHLRLALAAQRPLAGRRKHTPARCGHSDTTHRDCNSCDGVQRNDNPVTLPRRL